MSTTPARSRATITELDALHGMLAQVFTDYLTRCIAGDQKAEPSMLGQIVKFLAANGIDQPARAAGIDRLLGRLPSDAELDAMSAGLVIPFGRPTN